VRKIFDFLDKEYKKVNPDVDSAFYKGVIEKLADSYFLKNAKL